jgi:hypothetical protein
MMMRLSLSERDTEFFGEIYHLMKEKYPEMEEKFGLWRIHQHFELKEDEVFHETSDANTKESILKIIKKKDLPEKAFGSTWQLTSTGPVVATWCCDDDRRIV